jgi:hypothetical protein
MHRGAGPLVAAVAFTLLVPRRIGAGSRLEDKRGRMADRRAPRPRRRAVDLRWIGRQMW